MYVHGGLFISRAQAELRSAPSRKDKPGFTSQHCLDPPCFIQSFMSVLPIYERTLNFPCSETTLRVGEGLKGLLTGVLLLGSTSMHLVNLW